MSTDDHELAREAQEEANAAELHYRGEAKRIVDDFVSNELPKIVPAMAPALTPIAVVELKEVVYAYLRSGFMPAKPIKGGKPQEPQDLTSAEGTGRWLAAIAGRGGASPSRASAAPSSLPEARLYELLTEALSLTSHSAGLALRSAFATAIADALNRRRPDLVLQLGERLRAVAEYLEDEVCAVVAFRLARRVDSDQMRTINPDPKGVLKAYRKRLKDRVTSGNPVDGDDNFFVPPLQDL